MAGDGRPELHATAEGAGVLAFGAIAGSATAASLACTRSSGCSVASCRPSSGASGDGRAWLHRTWSARSPLLGWERCFSPPRSRSQGLLVVPSPAGRVSPRRARSVGDRGARGLRVQSGEHPLNAHALAAGLAPILGPMPAMAAVGGVGLALLVCAAPLVAGRHGGANTATWAAVLVACASISIPPFAALTSEFPVELLALGCLALAFGLAICDGSAPAWRSASPPRAWRPRRPSSSRRSR